MEREMTPEQNLDDDILQCRAEINQSLNMDPAEEQAGAPVEEENVHPDPDFLDADAGSDLSENPLQEESSLPVAQSPEDPIQESTRKTLVFPRDIDAYQTLPMLYGEEVRAKELAHTFENSMQQLKLLGLQLRGLFEDERQSKHLAFDGDCMFLVFGAATKAFQRAYEYEISDVGFDLLLALSSLGTLL